MSKKVRNILILVIAVLVVGSCIFMFVISPFKVRTGNMEMPDANAQTGEILNGIVIEQAFVNQTEDIEELAIVFNRAYDLGEKVNIIIELVDGDNVLMSKSVTADGIRSNHRTYVKTDSPITGLVGKTLTLRVYTDSTAGTGLSLMINTDSNSFIAYGSEAIKGTICFSVTGKE